MDIRQLQNFQRIVELQSLSKAAAVVRIAQPALSRQVKALEDELGVELLTRHGWGVAPTPAGRILVEHAERILAQALMARDAVRNFQAEASGRLSFGAPTSIGLTLLPHLASLVRRRYPKVKLHLMEGFSASVHEWALNGKLDMAILYQSRAMGHLRSTPLLTEAMTVVGPGGRFPRDSTIGAAGLAGLPLILPGRPNRLRLLVEEAWLEVGAPIDPVMEVDALPTIIELVRRGEGCTLLPYSTVHEKVSVGELSFATLDARNFMRTLVLVQPSERAPTPATKALTLEIQRFVHERADALRWQPLSSSGDKSTGIFRRRSRRPVSTR
jgi:LysR family nitrogen assimilation transcriptional regulator